MDGKSTTIPLVLTNGQIVHAEVTALSGGSRATNVSAQPTRMDPQKISVVMSTVEGLADAVSGLLSRVSCQEAQVEFGLEFGVESGHLTTLLVKGTGSANLKITLSWKVKEVDALAH